MNLRWQEVTVLTEATVQQAYRKAPAQNFQPKKRPQFSLSVMLYKECSKNTALLGEEKATIQVAVTFSTVKW